MENVIHFLRSQYLGCNSLHSIEGNMECLRQIYNDKQSIYNELQITQQQKNEIILLQEELNIELKNVTELKSSLSQERNRSDFDKVLDWHKEKSVLQLNVRIYKVSNIVIIVECAGFLRYHFFRSLNAVVIWK